MRAIAQFTITDLYDTDGLSIGGRNLLRQTRDMSGFAWGRYTGSAGGTFVDDGSGYTYADFADDSAYTGSGGSLSRWIMSTPYPLSKDEILDKDVVLSFDFKSSTDVAPSANNICLEFALCSDTSTSRLRYKLAYLKQPVSDQWQRLTFKTTLTADSFTMGSGEAADCTRFWVRIYFAKQNQYMLRKPKLETGTAPTDWTPAPEDVDSDITAVRHKLTDFITGEYAEDLQEIALQIDGKAETWYQDTDPSTSWSASEKATHTGDLWYKTTDSTTWRYNGTEWVEQEAPKEVFDAIDGKAQIFVNTPTPPYEVGDLWFNSTTSDILTCMTAKTSSQSYAASDWVKRNKYTDDTAANTAQQTIDDFINDDYAGFVESITGQVSDIEDNLSITWYYDYAPSATKAPTNEWTTTAQKDEHLGDMFFNTATGYSYIYTKSGSTYSWTIIKDADAATALANAATAQDTADNKRRVFYAQPTPPYDKGDLWVQGSSGDIYYCSTAKASGSFAQSEWSLASKYTDNSVANSKAQVYYGTTDPPTTGTYNTGDIWVKRVASGTGGDVMYYYNGSSWVMHAVGTTTIKSGSIVTDLLAANAVTAAKINVTDLFAQDITATGTITGATLIGPTIKTNTFNINPSTTGDGSFNIYGYYGTTLYNMCQIAYSDSGDFPTTVFSSPSDAYASWAFTQTYVGGTVYLDGATVDFSGATVQNLSVNSATSATKDSAGNTISTTYLAKSGGIMSGNLGFANAKGVYGTTTDGSTAWLAYINSSDQLQYGSSTMPVYFWTNGYFYVRQSDGTWVNLIDGAVSPTLVSTTQLTVTGVAMEGLYVYTIGKVAYVRAQITLSEGGVYTSWTNIASGLPTPRLTIYDQCAARSSTFSRALDLRVSTDGYLQIRYGANNGGWMYFVNFCYPIA